MSSGHQEQRGGIGSTNFQTNIEIHQYRGVSVCEAHQIAQSVYDANIVRLYDVAREVMNARAAEIREEIIAEVAKNQAALDELRHPDKQAALYEAQKSYALTGDKELKSLLSKMVIDITAERGRTLRSIALGEALTVISKLTRNQLNILAVKFAVESVRINVPGDRQFSPSSDIAVAAIILYGLIDLFLSELDVSKREFIHIEYTGCGTRGFVDAIHIAQLLRNTYPTLFTGSDENVCELLLMAEPKLAPLLTAWNTSAMGGLRLTSVGVAIAHTYLAEKVNLPLALDIWL